MANKFDLKTLYPKLVRGEITDEELNWLLEYFNTGDREAMNQFVRSELALSGGEEPAAGAEDIAAEETPGSPQAIETPQVAKASEIAGVPGTWQARKPVLRRFWFRAAASVAILGAALSVLLYIYPGTGENPRSSGIYPDDVAPGRVTATLTLADGRKIMLSDTLSGELAKEAGVLITQSADGQLIYEIAGPAYESGADRPGGSGGPAQANSPSGAIKMNTLATSAGETYQVRLPDGSLVALNAASSITYATSLTTGGERRVELKGEAYFEVARDKAHPFIVQSGRQTVKVLGTRFNIKAYTDEPAIQTTLLEGSVKVDSEGSAATLKPGEQAVLPEQGDGIQVRAVETEDIVAWKNGYFMFNSERLESIMAKVARWYGVDVEFDDPSLKNETFFGSISRFENVSKLLKLLEATDVAVFNVRGNKIYIDKK